LEPDVVTDFVADAVVFVDSATLSFSVILSRPVGTDDVAECKRFSRTSGDFLPPFTVLTVFGEIVVGRTTAFCSVWDLSTSGICEISAAGFSSVPSMSDDVFSRPMSETVRVDDVRSCSVEGSVVVLCNDVPNLSVVVDLNGGETLELEVSEAVELAAVWSRGSSVLDVVVPMPYIFIRSAREDTVTADLAAAGCSTAAEDDCSTSDRSLIAVLVAATGEVILLRVVATGPSVAPSLVKTSPRRVPERDLADITLL